MISPALVTGAITSGRGSERQLVGILGGGSDAPYISSFSFLNDTGVDKNNTLVDPGMAYNISVVIEDNNGWSDIEWVNVTLWYDNGDDASEYNDTAGANLNYFFSYNQDNDTFFVHWPTTGELTGADNGTSSNWTLNATSNRLNFIFTPGKQFRRAPGDGAWDTASGYNDLFSWNYAINATDAAGDSHEVGGEFGVYSFTELYVDDTTPYASGNPGGWAAATPITMRESSNEAYYMNISLGGNLSRGDWVPDYIEVFNVNVSGGEVTGLDTGGNTFFNVTSADPFAWNDLSKSVKNTGVQISGNSQEVTDLTFRIYIPMGTVGGSYRTEITWTLSQKV